jgi:hypothetical protein
MLHHSQLAFYEQAFRPVPQENLSFVEQAGKPVADKGAISQLKPTGKNESFFKPFQKSYNIKPVGIVIIHLSLFFSSEFSAFSAFISFRYNRK